MVLGFIHRVGTPKKFHGFHVSIDAPRKDYLAERFADVGNGKVPTPVDVWEILPCPTPVTDYITNLRSYKRALVRKTYSGVVVEGYKMPDGIDCPIEMPLHLSWDADGMWWYGVTKFRSGWFGIWSVRRIDS
jgi:hypothetical protein